jgi:hypothetical protein
LLLLLFIWPTQQRWAGSFERKILGPDVKTQGGSKEGVNQLLTKHGD